jgi:signal transduction histidine kinase
MAGPSDPRYRRAQFEGLTNAELLGVRWRPAWLIGALLLVALQSATADPQRVLLLHSFGPNFAPWNVISERLRADLVKQSPAGIDLYEVSLQPGRVNPPGPQQPFLDYLRSLFVGHDPDLVIAMGGPAARFVQQNRSNSFPSAPLLIAGVDERSFNSASLTPYDIAVPVRIDEARQIEAILQVMPSVTKIAVVIGNSPFEKFWLEECQRSFQRFSNRVTFDWFNELSLEEMVKRAAELPSRSAIFYATVRVDGRGVPQEEDAVLARLRKTATAPIFTYIDNHFGDGIVGGPMISAERTASQSAAAAVRILNGERPANIKMATVELSAPVYDWRELQRWNIRESALPSGSIVQFREPAAWERYRTQILFISFALLLQSVLISWLIYEHWRRQRAEAESLQRANELARMNRYATAGELSASIAHEIRQPLSAIAFSGSAGLNWLKSKVPDLDEVRAVLETIVSESHRADDVINSVRAMFRNESATRTEVNLNDLVQQVIALAERPIDTNSIALQMKLADDPPPIVMADPVQLQQVILNLVMNAIEALCSSDHLARILRIETSIDPDGTVFLTVEDSGPGFDAKVADNLFHPFVTTKPKGMGMGLSICKSIIEKHGGELTATSVKPRGAMLRIALPGAQQRMLVVNKKETAPLTSSPR